MLETIKIKPNNINSLAIKRKVQADKWSFVGGWCVTCPWYLSIIVYLGLKYSSYENPAAAKNPPGVTKYTALPKCNKKRVIDLEAKMKKLIMHVTDSFKPSMCDVTRRHQLVQSHLISDSTDIRGASVGL